MDTARLTVIKALQRQEQNGYANIVLDHALRKAELTSQEKAFCSRIFYGTLERMYALDAVLNRCSRKNVKQLDVPIRAILRSALYQAAYMQVPASAAVNEAVELTREVGKSSAAGFVNAVLRKAVLVDFNEFKFKNDAEKYSVSEDVFRVLKQVYPKKYKSILENSYSDGCTAIRVNTLKTDIIALTRMLEDCGAVVCRSAVDNGLILQNQGALTLIKPFQDGLFHVQGLASQYAVACLNAQPGQKVLDLCAAPGGKSVSISQYMKNEGELFSCELQSARLSLIEDNFRRCGIKNATVMQGDASVFRTELLEADRVLCDVPCSGLGVMGKKPDIRYKKFEDLKELCHIQQAILNNAAKYLKPGGRLVYSTCTVNPDENEKIIEGFLNTHDNYVSVKPPYLLNNCSSGIYGTTIFPNIENHLDGFFVSILQRIE